MTTYETRSIQNVQCSSIPAWYRRSLPDGAFYFTPERRSKRKVIIAGPGDRDPHPNELAKALNDHPAADLEKGGKILTEEDAEDTSESSLELPNGVYSYEPGTHATPSRLEPMELRSDTFLSLPGIYEKFVEDIRSFLSAGAIYRNLGYQYRRGLLLYGPPGNGKTNLIRETIRNVIPEDSITIFMERIPPRNFIRAIQNTLQSRLKVIIFEELAVTLKRSNLDNVLAFLDGENSLDGCLILATTNYPGRLPGNIVDRPSRFDRLYQISDPSGDSRRVLLEYYLKRSIADEEIEITQGLSVAGIREACFLVRLRNLQLKDASRILKNHHDLAKREFGAMGEIGIQGRSFTEDYFEDY